MSGNEPHTEIPNRVFFRIGDVCRIVGLDPHVLRYWEAEFPALQPKKTPKGHRRYRRADVELVLRIKHLLYDRKYTIAGARKALEREPGKQRGSGPELVAVPLESLAGIADELRRIAGLLEDPSAGS